MPKQDLLQALTPDGSREIPVILPYEGIYIRDHAAELITVPWWYEFEPDFDRQSQYIQQYMDAVDHDVYYPRLSYTDNYRARHCLELAESCAFLRDTTDGRMESVNPPRIGGSEDALMDRFIPYEEIERDLDNLAETISTTAYRSWGAGADRLARTQQLLAHGHKVGAGLISSPYSSCYDVWGFQGMMIAAVKDAPLVRFACQCFLDAALITLATLCDIGVKVITLEDCFSDMLSPECYRLFALEYNEPLIRAAEAAGVRTIYYFTGNAKGKLDLIFSLDADAYAFEEDKKGFHNPLDEIWECLGGRASLVGNMDAIGVLQNASDERLEAEVLRMRMIAIQTGGRFVYSLGSPVTSGTSVARVNRFLQLARKWAML